MIMALDGMTKLMMSYPGIPPWDIFKMEFVWGMSYKNFVFLLFFADSIL